MGHFRVAELMDPKRYGHGARDPNMKTTNPGTVDIQMMKHIEIISFYFFFTCSYELLLLVLYRTSILIYIFFMFQKNHMSFSCFQNVRSISWGCMARPGALTLYCSFDRLLISHDFGRRY